MPVRTRTNEDETRTLDASSHTPTRTRTNCSGSVLKFGILVPFHPAIPNVCLVEEEIMLSAVPPPTTIAHSTYWAGLHVCWSMAQEHGSAGPLPPVCDEGSGSLLGTGRKTDSGWDLLMQMPTNGGGTDKEPREQD